MALTKNDFENIAYQLSYSVDKGYLKEAIKLYPAYQALVRQRSVKDVQSVNWDCGLTLGKILRIFTFAQKFEYYTVFSYPDLNNLFHLVLQSKREQPYEGEKLDRLIGIYDFYEAKLNLKIHELENDKNNRITVLAELIRQCSLHAHHDTIRFEDIGLQLAKDDPRILCAIAQSLINQNQSAACVQIFGYRILPGGELERNIPAHLIVAEALINCHQLKKAVKILDALLLTDDVIEPGQRRQADYLLDIANCKRNDFPQPMAEP